MKAHAIELHIEELILHGHASSHGPDVAEAVQAELGRLLAAHGLPAAWQASPEKLDAGPVRTPASASSAALGRQVARAVYQGETKA